MDIRLFQINTERDTENVCYTPFKNLPEQAVDASIYDLTWAGEIKNRHTDLESDLEDVYGLFNSRQKPDDFHGRNMAPSDVVEVQYADGSDFYYADGEGFHKIDFDADMTSKKFKETMTVVLVEPGKKAKIGQIGKELEDLQKYVGGLIQCVYPFEDEVCIVCGDEAKLQGLPYNRCLRSEDGDVYDVIAGNFFICSCKGCDFSSLSVDEQKKYQKMYERPELFFCTDAGLAVAVVDERENKRHR